MQTYSTVRKDGQLRKVSANVDYNPTATNVIIHNNDDGTDWDIESWMSDLSDDPEVVELLWQITHHS